MRYVYFLQLNNEIGYSVGICTLAYYKIRTVVGVIRGMQLCTLNDQLNHQQQQQKLLLLLLQLLLIIIILLLLIIIIKIIIMIIIIIIQL